MKRLLSCILLAVFLVSFCGCSEKANSSDTTKKAVSETDKKRKSYDMKEEKFVQLLSYYVSEQNMVLKKMGQDEKSGMYTFSHEYSVEMNFIHLFLDDEGNISGLDMTLCYQYDDELGCFVLPIDTEVIATMVVSDLHDVAPTNIWEHFYPEDAPKDEEGTFEGSEYWVRYKDKKVSIMLNPKQ